MLIRRIRGTSDLYQNDILLFEYILSTVKEVAKRCIFNQLSTPILEYSEVFHRTLGDTSDIINKETYSFLDRDKKYLTLRPEFTASVVRAAIENGLLQNLPLKLFSYGPLFRHERPQKCRLRQFHQFNFEHIGSKGSNADLELLLMAQSILDTFTLSNVKLHINSLGSREDSARYREALVCYLEKYKNDLSAISQERLSKNVLRILDSKDIEDKKIIKGAPLITNFLGISAKKSLDHITEQLHNLNMEFIISPRLVRGIDYYSNTVFEFVSNDLGSQGTVIAGGRYDYLIKQMGGPEIPASGFAGGFERISTLLAMKKLKIESRETLCLIPIGNIAEDYAVRLAHKLRTKHLLCTELHFGLTLKKRMQKANKLGCEYVLIFGEDEMKCGKLLVKNMKTGTERLVQEVELVAYLNISESMEK